MNTENQRKDVEKVMLFRAGESKVREKIRDDNCQPYYDINTDI